MRSFWLQQALGAEGAETAEAPPLDGDTRADVCIVGGGFTGLWTAPAPQGTRTGARRRHRRGRHLRRRRQRAQRRLRHDLDVEGADVAQNLRRPGRRAAAARVRGRRCGDRRVLRRARASRPTSATMAGCGRRATRPSSAPGPRPSRRSTSWASMRWKNCRPTRSPGAPARKAISPASTSAASRPCSRRGWRAGFDGSRSSAACASMNRRA